jgi:RAS protein activator-like 1
MEKWFKLMPVDKDYEVQGEVEIETLIDDTDDIVLVHVHIHRARDLAAKDPTGSSDPFLQFACGEKKFTTLVA